MLRIGSGGTGDRDLHDALHSWLLHLPKVLWEIGDKNAAASEVCHFSRSRPSAEVDALAAHHALSATLDTTSSMDLYP